MSAQTGMVLGQELTLTRNVRSGDHGWWVVGSIEVVDLKINNRLYSGRVYVRTRYGITQQWFDTWELLNTEGNSITEKARVKLSDALKAAFEVVPPSDDEMRTVAIDAVKSEARYHASFFLYKANRAVRDDDKLSGLLTPKEIEGLAVDAMREYFKGEGVAL